MKRIKLPQNPFLLFSPFLLLFVIYVIIFTDPNVSGDGTRYIGLAKNLLHGYYSPAAPNINLPNGPGFPIYLMPFFAMGLPILCITLMNALFHYLSIVFLFKALRRVVNFQIAFVFSLFWACYYIAYQNMSAVTTETITMFLLSVLIYCMLRAFEPADWKTSRKYIILSGLLLGYIALIKVIFGYVILLLLVGCGLLWLIKRGVKNYRRSLLVVAIAFCVTIPYLLYTYNLTGRVLYWGTGSDNIYWMTTPYEDEFGDWKGELTRGTIDMGNYNIPGAEDSLAAHHKKDFDEAFQYTGMKRDEVFKRIAMENIKSHPVKYVKNIFYNIGRMLFHYPYSYAVERRKSLFAMPINGIMLTFILLALIPTFMNWRKILYPIRFLLFLVLVYMGGSAILSSDLRMFALIVPVLLLWIAYMAGKVVKVKLKMVPDSPVQQ